MGLLVGKADSLGVVVGAGDGSDDFVVPEVGPAVITVGLEEGRVLVDVANDGPGVAGVAAADGPGVAPTVGSADTI